MGFKMHDGMKEHFFESPAYHEFREWSVPPRACCVDMQPTGAWVAHGTFLSLPAYSTAACFLFLSLPVEPSK